MAKFNILNKAEKVELYVFMITDKSPKKLRCDIVPTVRNIAIQITNNISKANIYNIGDSGQLKKRQECQSEALINLRLLEVQAEICNKMNYITNAQLTNLSQLTFELYNMITKWTESDLVRCTTE